jgi:hypothetical protein
MLNTFANWQLLYAEHGLPIFPVKIVGNDKKPAIKGWQNVGLRGSGKLALKFADAEAFGFNCGKRNRLTLIDIDSHDVREVRAAIEVFGESPVIWRTGSGNHAMPFRYNSEGRHIRPIKGLSVDVLGAGYAVAPGSMGAKGPYEFIQGGLADFDRLPAARMPAELRPREKTPFDLKAKQWQGETIYEGKRNDILFNFALDQARYVDDRDALIDVVRTRNLDCEMPLEDIEVVKVASSAWGYQLRGENLKGRGGAVVVSNELLDTLNDHPDSCLLYLKLRRHHWGKDFVLANGMATSMGWGLRKWQRARDLLVRLGIIACVHEGGSGPGDPPVYGWVAKVCQPAYQ